jgi:hypothetical protein
MSYEIYLNDFSMIRQIPDVNVIDTTYMIIDDQELSIIGTDNIPIIALQRVFPVVDERIYYIVHSCINNLSRRSSHELLED